MPITPAFNTTRARALAHEYGGRLRDEILAACDEIDAHREGLTRIETVGGQVTYVDISGADQVADLARRVPPIEAFRELALRVDDLEDRVGSLKLTEALPLIHARLDETLPRIHERIDRLEEHASHDLDGLLERVARLEMPKGAE